MTDPILLVPGHMCDARVFGPQIRAFSRQGAVHVACGARSGSIPAMARDVLDSAPRRFWLAGLSLGGIVAMEIVRQAQERLAGIALIDTNHRAESETVAEYRKLRMARARSGELEAVVRDEMKPHYLADGPSRPDVLKLVMSMAAGFGADVFLRQSEALLCRPDQTDSLLSIKVPCIVMCGAEDALCPPRIHEEMAGIISGAKLAIISGAGHLPTLEQPEATNEVLAEWMGEG